MVVAHHREHAASWAGAGRVRMLHRVHGPIEAGALAVPHAEHAVMAGARVQADLLGSPDRGGTQLLVHAGLEHDTVCIEEIPRAPKLLVEPTERRAAVAGDEAGGVEAGGTVAPGLDERQSHQRLKAAHENASVLETIFVVKVDGQGIDEHPLDLSVWPFGRYRSVQSLRVGLAAAGIKRSALLAAAPLLASVRAHVIGRRLPGTRRAWRNW
jgi:hypothetical protein